MKPKYKAGQVIHWTTTIGRYKTRIVMSFSSVSDVYRTLQIDPVDPIWKCYIEVYDRTYIEECYELKV